jgi:hypothetical protein
MAIEYVETVDKEENTISIDSDVVNKDISEIEVGSLYEDYVSEDNAFGFNN